MTDSQVKLLIEQAVNSAFAEGYRLGREAGKSEVIAENTRLSSSNRLVREFGERAEQAARVAPNG